jgi:methionyl-tRNA formyltransferase
MKAVIFTSNSIRHKFFANSLQNYLDDLLVVSECRENDEFNESYGENDQIINHFKNRNKIENEFFDGNDEFNNKCIPILYNEVNHNFIYEKIKKYNPDVMIVFGSSIIKEPLLSLSKKNRFLNLHLGLSPYYKGNATNFWPFINNELEFLGSTILHIDSGIDTGDIITHVRPKIDQNDNVHTIGCKIIQESVRKMGMILNLIKEKKEINRIPQWNIKNEKIYKLKDFNEKILENYLKKIENGIVEKFLSEEEKEIKIINSIEPK